MSSSWPREITTARLNLRPITVEDRGELVEIMWQEREHLRPSIEVGDTRDAASLRVSKLVDAFAAGTHRVYVIRAAATIIGCLAARPNPARQSIALSYWLRACHTGQGYATEAAAALSEVILDHAERLEICCYADNVASAGVARRLGFVLSGVAREAERPLHLWTAERATLSVRNAVMRACSNVAAVAMDDDGTVYADDASFRIGSVAGQPFVVAVSEIGAEDAHDARASLAHNTTLAVGALGIEDDRLVLRYAGPLAAITPDTIRLFLHEADRLRRLVWRPTATTDICLSAYFTA